MHERSERTAEIALVAVLSGVSAVPYAAFFAGRSFVAPLAAAAAGPAAVVAVAGRRRPAVVGVVLVAALPLAVAGLVRVAPGSGVTDLGHALSVTGRGLVDGWDAMLAAARPADAAGDLLVTPLALTWLASAAAALLAVHRPGPGLPVVPPAVALVGALALTGDQGRYRTAVAGAFLIVALALVLVRANHHEAAALSPAASASSSSDATRVLTPAARVAFGFPLVVGIAVVSPLVAGALPPARGPRFDPRDLRDERLAIDDALSPLVTLKAQLEAHPALPLFRVELTGPAPGRPDRLRTAALDDYDGALFTSDADYRRAGHTLAGDPALGDRPAPGARVRVRVTVLGLPGPFLPAAGRPVTLGGDMAGDRLGFDARTGTLVTARTDLTGLRYDVVGAVVTPTDDQIAAARPSQATEPGLAGLAVAPPRLPPDIAALAQTWTSGARTRGDELLALRDRLRAVRYDDSADAPPGHSYAALRRVLLGDQNARQGYAEQMAAAFVVLARARGIPARVATGYLLPEPGPGGAVTVTEADAHAWPEVHLDGLGWVPIEATGRRTAIPPPQHDTQIPPGARADQPDNAARPSPPVPPSIVEPDDPGPGAGRGGLGVAGAAALGGGLVVLVVLALLAAPAAAKATRRHRRRRAASPADRVVGAWRETVDRLVEAGLPVHTAQTAAEVAAAARGRFPDRAAAVAQLVPLVGVAVCAPFPPAEAAADRAWQLAGVARADLRRGAGPVRRVRAALDPRPLLPRPTGGRGRSGVPDARLRHSETPELDQPSVDSSRRHPAGPARSPGVPQRPEPRPGVPAESPPQVLPPAGPPATNGRHPERVR